jgi:hypothetical protein
MSHGKFPPNTSGRTEALPDRGSDSGTSSAELGLHYLDFPPPAPPPPGAPVPGPPSRGPSRCSVMKLTI